MNPENVQPIIQKQSRARLQTEIISTRAERVIEPTRNLKTLRNKSHNTEQKVVD